MINDKKETEMSDYVGRKKISIKQYKCQYTLVIKDYNKEVIIFLIAWINEG